MSLRECPECGERKTIQAGKLVYPFSADWWERYCLVCWDCNMVYRRDEGWKPIDIKRHEVEWALERKAWKLQELENLDDRRVKKMVEAARSARATARLTRKAAGRKRGGRRGRWLVARGDAWQSE